MTAGKCEVVGANISLGSHIIVHKIHTYMHACTHRHIRELLKDLLKELPQQGLVQLQTSKICQTSAV